MIPEIPKGKFYDCRDSERLTHTTPEDAVEDWLECFLYPNCDVSAVIRERCPVTLTAHVPSKVDDQWKRGLARRLLEDAAESFYEGYGDPDGNESPGREAVEALLPAMLSVLDGLFSHGEVWSCETVGSAELDASAVEEMMRAARPDWWI